MTKKLILPLLLASILAACGGGGGGGVASTDTGSGTNNAGSTGSGGNTSTSTGSGGSSTLVSEAATPMSTLVVPTSMTWTTAATAAMTINVIGADGSVQKDASVTVSTFTDVSPHDASPLRRPVALELIDSGVSDVSGQVLMSARVPAHVVKLLLVASKGEQSGQTVVSVADMKSSTSIQIAP